MLYKANGYFFAELLLSLSVWVLLTLFLLPIYIHMERQSLNTEYKREANRLLYDSLQEYVLTGHEIEGKTIVIRDKEYTITKDLAQLKVCVNYEETNKTLVSLCEILE